MKRISFCTLGCKLNFAETSTLTRRFAEEGYVKVPFGEEADVVVVNTCSVTAQADKKCRQAIAKAHHTSPDAMIAVMGCYAQLKADELSRLPGVRIVLGAQDKQHLPEYVAQAAGKSVIGCGLGPIFNPDVRLSYEGAYSLYDRTRSFLKIQDGCDFRCAYCAVPLARGNSRNAPVKEIVAAAREIAASGMREIVITGVNIGDFGKTTGESLLSLLQDLDAVKGIERFRISSIEPNLLTPDIIRFVASSRAFVPHFHMPLQSGCDRTLQRMGRRYGREVFAQRVREIRECMPDASIGADVIVGFPGETEADFEDTFALLRETDLAYCHVFPFSERPGTRAVDMPDKVSPEEKERRSHILLQWSENQKIKFYNSFVGTTRTVLFESKSSDGMMLGYTDNYLKVAVPYEQALVGRTASVMPDVLVRPGLLHGRLINN